VNKKKSRKIKTTTTTPKMLTRDIYQLTEEFPLSDRLDLDLAIERYKLLLDFTVARVEIKRGSHTDSCGQTRKFWRVSFYKSEQHFPIASHSASSKNVTVPESYKFSMEVDRAIAVHAPQIAAECRKRGITLWRTTFEERHNSNGDEIYLASVYA